MQYSAISALAGVNERGMATKKRKKHKKAQAESAIFAASHFLFFVLFVFFRGNPLQHLPGINEQSGDLVLALRQETPF